MADKKLPPKRQLFVERYLVHLNATKAAGEAGYSHRVANREGWRLLQIPEVQAAIEVAVSKRSARVQVEQDEVLTALLHVMRADPRKLAKADGTPITNVQELDDATALAIARIEIETVPGEQMRGADGAPIFNDAGSPVFKEPLRRLEVAFIDKGPAIRTAMQHLGLLKSKLELTGKDGDLLQIIIGDERPTGAH